MSELRRRNMDLRRNRILMAARRAIARDGLESMTVRSLAAEAGVTVPTIYNLVGSREDVLASICEAALDELDRRLEAEAGPSRGLSRAEAVVSVSADLFLAEPETYRAVFRAIERQTLQAGMDPRGARSLKRCADLQAQACREAREDGDLAGLLDPELLGEQVLGLYRIALRRWEIGEIDGGAFRRQALYGLFVCLLADATPRAANEIRSRILGLQDQLTNRAALAS
jgi:AcrR family transcriptional regulator